MEWIILRIAIITPVPSFIVDLLFWVEFKALDFQISDLFLVRIFCSDCYCNNCYNYLMFSFFMNFLVLLSIRSFIFIKVIAPGCVERSQILVLLPCFVDFIRLKHQTSKISLLLQLMGLWSSVFLVIEALMTPQTSLRAVSFV